VTHPPPGATSARRYIRLVILTGFDGSDGGRDALELTRVLAKLENSRVLVVSVIAYGPLPINYVLLDEEEAATAAALFEEARSRLDEMTVEARAYGGGSPAAVINDIAEREEVATIVVGSPHRGPVGRVLAGSVAEGLLGGAPCEVAAAPHGYGGEEHLGLHAVGIAYDGTPEARAALRRAERIALAANARVKVFTVVEPLVAMPGVGGYTPALPAPEELIHDAVNALDERLGAETRQLSGPAAAAIAAACEDDVDLLVAGSRGYGPVARVLLGSVSRQLVRKAPCPVLVVPRPEVTKSDD
jgi:nucleotide-binding universal stress UspA family protein